MGSILKSLFNPLRITIPWFMDVVIVSDPDQIKRIEASGDVDRLHVYDTAALPWWVRYFFSATKFHDDRRDLWFCPFESTANPTYPPRRAYLEGKVGEGYTREDVLRIAALLTGNADDETLAHEMVQVVNRRFLGKEIPRSITKAAKYTLQDFIEAIFPWKYRRARKSREKILEFCASNLDPSVHLLDVGHNIGEVVQTTAGALRRLKDNLDRPIEETFTAQGLTPQVPRIAVKRSKLDGLLWRTTKPGKTVVILQNGTAAGKAHDLLFTFGTGRPERACVFMPFFLAFMSDLQKELKDARAQALSSGLPQPGPDSNGLPPAAH
jgi:hypothetical protein